MFIMKKCILHVMIAIIAAFVVVVSCGFGEGGSKRFAGKGGKDVLDELTKTDAGDCGAAGAGNGTGGESGDAALARNFAG